MALSLRHLIMGLAILAIGAGLHGQATSPDKPKEVNLKFTVFALGGLENLSYVPSVNAGTMPLKFYSAYRSATYTYHGEAKLCFYDEAGGRGTGAAPIAVYTIPESARQQLLLFFANTAKEGSGPKYTIYGVDDDMGKTPPGSFSTINVSGREYLAEYKGSRITIPEGVGPAHAAKGRVSLLLATQVKGDWMSSGRHVFSMGEQDRVILIFYPPSSGTGVYPIIRHLTDTVPPPEKKPENYVQATVAAGD